MMIEEELEDELEIDEEDSEAEEAEEVEEAEAPEVIEVSEGSEEVTLKKDHMHNGKLLKEGEICHVMPDQKQWMTELELI